MLQTATTASAARQDRKRCEGAELTGTTALAACEPQGLDGVAVILGEAMKPEVVKRRRNRSGINVAREASRWRYLAFGALSDWHGIATCEPQAPCGVLR